MTMKKTWFSYLLWVLYTMIAGILLTIHLSSVIVRIWGANKYVMAGMIGIFFAGTIGIWFAFRTLIPYIIRKIPEDKHYRNMWECFLALSLMAASVLYRVHYLLHSTNVDILKTTYYEMAKVTDKGEILNMTHGASYVYTVLLSVVFSFIGNKVFAGVILQFVIQVLTMLFLYFSLRLLTGKISALVATAFLAFAPIYVYNMFSLTPEGLYLLFYAAGLWGISLYLNGLKKNGYKTKGAYLSFILLGIYIGLISYLDIIGITLLLFAGIGFVLVRERDDMEIWVGRQFIVVLLAFFVTAAGIMALDSIYSQQEFLQILTAWYVESPALHTTAGIVNLFMGFEAQPLIGIICCIPALFSAIGFWVNKEQRIDVWILVLLVLLSLNLNGNKQMDYHIFAVFLWGVFGGLGVSSIGIGIENAYKTEEAAEPEIVAAQQPYELEEIDELDELDELDEPEKIDTVKPLDNPLPLPKKHVKKEMDYDVLVNENDDFDI